MRMTPTVFIGLDGATFDVLDPLIADGHMPRLKALLERGVRAELLTTPHPLTPPAWTTLMTGVNPGSHGIIDFLRLQQRAGGVFLMLNDFRDIRAETIWSIVSRHGGRVATLNFPLMAPPPKINGCVVPGLLSWRHLRRNVHPPELFDELQQLPGFDPVQLSFDFENEKKALQDVPAEGLEQWVRFHIERERQWFTVLRHVMRSGPRCDLTAMLFDGVDKLQHGCWHLLDPREVPSEMTALDKTLRSLCEQYFQELDDFIGQIADWAGPEARIVLASDHGFAAMRRSFRVNKWLEQQGYLAWQDDAKQGSNANRLSAPGPQLRIDFSRTVAYAPSPATNGIHIQIARNDDEVGVRPDEYESVRDRLIDQLLSVTDSESGERIVTRVMKREDAFPGQYMDHAPDLTLELNDFGFVSVANAEPIVAQRDRIVGTHGPVGMMAAAGPGVKPGETLPQQSIVDMAPLLLHSLGLPIPAHFEGRVPEEVFDAAYLHSNPVRIADHDEPVRADQEDATAEQTIDDEEQQKIIDRLRALGYVE